MWVIYMKKRIFIANDFRNRDCASGKIGQKRQVRVFSYPPSITFLNVVRYISIGVSALLTVISASIPLTKAAVTFAKEPEREYVITTPGQLADIQRLASLYVETSGKQGCMDLLTSAETQIVLAADIELPENWVPIGDYSANPDFVFRGSFDGRGHTISGLRITASKDAANAPNDYNRENEQAGEKRDASPMQTTTTFGLFGRVENADISNIILADASIILENTGAMQEGVFAAETGFAGDDRLVADRFRKATDDTNGMEATVGLLAGQAVDSRIQNITVINGNIIAGDATVGGIIGLAVDTDIYFSQIQSGHVTGKHITGGFAGRVVGTCQIHGCHSHADVTGGIAGGFIGQVVGKPLSTNANHGVVIYQCSAKGSVTNVGNASNGVSVTAGVGNNSSTITSALHNKHAIGIAGGFIAEGSYTLVRDCAAYGEVRSKAVGYTATGGFIGRLSDFSRVIYAYSKGDVFADGADGSTESIVGGFVGVIEGAACIEFSLSQGSVISGLTDQNAAIGGFVGVISAAGAPNTITHSLSFAPWVVGSGYVHRFAGRVDHNGINGCYASLGSMVVKDDALAHVQPNAFGLDGADMSGTQVEAITQRLGWTRLALRL